MNYFDQDKLEKIVGNLLSNALKYTPDNGYIKFEIEKLENGFVKIEITDNGIGIKEDEAKNIFKRFNREEHPYYMC